MIGETPGPLKDVETLVGNDVVLVKEQDLIPVVMEHFEEELEAEETNLLVEVEVYSLLYSLALVVEGVVYQEA
jgi:hypothetical protein